MSYFDDAVTAHRNMNLLKAFGFNDHQTKLYGQTYLSAMRTDKQIPVAPVRGDWAMSTNRDLQAVGMAVEDAIADGKTYH